MSDFCLLPDFSDAQAAALARRLFSLEGSLKRLAGERDLNFLIEGAQGKFVFKIANAAEAVEMLECQHQVFARLEADRVFPRVATAVASARGRFIESLTSEQGTTHLCRVLPFIEGRLLSGVGCPGPDLLENLGQSLARLDRSLADFSHPALDRPLLWNLCDAPQTLARFKPLLTKSSQRRLIESFEAGFRERVTRCEAQLRRGVIHNDANDNNVLIDPDEQHLLSIIDFGDMIDSWLVAEAAVAAAYAMLGRDDPLAVACAILRGYQRKLPLREIEVGVLFDLICMRLCMSVCICAHQRSLEPDNEYLGVSEKPAWEMLQILSEIDYAQAHRRMREACGF